MKQIYQASNILCYALLLLPSLLWGQWATQTITLEPGWNAIYLEVDPYPSNPFYEGGSPYPNECSTIFNGIDIESVWAPADQFNLIDPDIERLTYYPTPSAIAPTTLFALEGGKVYIINYLGTVPETMEISGRPTLGQQTWRAGIDRVAGFPVDATNPPTFTEFLASAPAFGVNAVQKMNSNGDWVAITDPNETINKGQAYRLKTNEFSTYASPFSVELAQENSLDFDQILLEQTIRIKNHSDAAKSITVEQLISADNIFAPYNLAGEVVLNYRDNVAEQWVSLSGGTTVNVAANGFALFRIAIDRLQMPFTSNGMYQSLLEFKDNQGTALVVPTSGFGLLDRTGLWVGAATINAVSETSLATNTPQATDSEFNMKLIVHVNDQGQAQLLDQVIQMWQDGIYKPNPDGSGTQVVDQAGQYVLVTDDALLGNYTGAAIRDGKAVGRRISSAFFSFATPQALTGDFDGILALKGLMLGYDDPMNPFKHQYHPDHNNMDERNENTLPVGVESYDIERDIQLVFSRNDPDGLSFPGFGDDQAGGTYLETIKIHSKAVQVIDGNGDPMTIQNTNDLYVKGTFRLNRISNVGKLNATSTPAQIAQRLPQPRPILPMAIEQVEEQTVSTTELATEKPLVKIYPNPVANSMQLVGLEAGNYTLSVRDFSGRILLNQAFHANDQINVQQLVPGIYVLEVRSAEWVHAIKFVKL